MYVQVKGVNIQVRCTNRNNSHQLVDNLCITFISN
ncbi:hypothetical protein VP501E541_P0149 [Vibrio phage 501E54-1]|nr:hypothetical protein VP501E541_P0149 [Vibrio phage 501E54-1]